MSSDPQLDQRRADLQSRIATLDRDALLAVEQLVADLLTPPTPPALSPEQEAELRRRADSARNPAIPKASVEQFRQRALQQLADVNRHVA